MLELGGKEDQKEDEIGRCFMLTFNRDPVVANDFACLNLDMNGRGVACIKMSHDSEGMHVLNVALDTCCEASVMNLDLFNKSFRDTGAVVSYTSTSLRNKALQAAEGSNEVRVGAGNVKIS